MKHKAIGKASKALARITRAKLGKARTHETNRRGKKAADRHAKQQKILKAFGLPELIRKIDPDATMPNLSYLKRELRKVEARVAERIAKRKDQRYPHYERVRVLKHNGKMTTMVLYVRDYVIQSIFLGSEAVLCELLKHLTLAVDCRDRPPTDSAKIRAKLYMTVEKFLRHRRDDGVEMLKLYRKCLKVASAPMPEYTHSSRGQKSVVCVPIKNTGNPVLDQFFMETADEETLLKELNKRKIELIAVKASKRWSRTVTMLSPSQYVVEKLYEAYHSQKNAA